MTTRSTRRVISALALSASLFTTAFTGYAHAATSGGQAVGSHQWGRDNWCYVFNGRDWVRDSYSRVYPDRTNGTVYDLFYNGQWVKRVDVSRPGWTIELTPANAAASSTVSWYMYRTNTSPTAANVYYFVKVFNQWMTLPQVQATVAAINRQGAPAGGMVLGGYGGSTNAGSASAPMILGGGTSTPNPNPLTVDSMNAEGARQTMSPQARQQLFELERVMQQSQDDSIKVDTLGTHVRVRR